jgi:hypothetical protein
MRYRIVSGRTRRRGGSKAVLSIKNLGNRKKRKKGKGRRKILRKSRS